MAGLTNKTFKLPSAENEKLGNLHGQMLQMNDDFEEMKRTREEAKKQLEARFQDVYRKIQNTKDFIAAEGKRINDTLLAFQSKFENELKNMDNKFMTLHKTTEEKNTNKFNEVDTNLKNLDKKIEDERQDRLKQSDENLRQIRQQLNHLQEQFDTEKRERIERDKEILQKLSDESFLLNERLEKERSERVFKTKELRDHTDYELKQMQKLNEDFHQKTIDEFNYVTSNLESEMNNRFNHQDSIVDNLSNVVKTIQDTLKIIGKDV